MKKMMVFSMVGLLMLSGCGGNDHSDTTKTEDESSYLIVKGEGIDENIKIDESNLEYIVTAIGNQPIAWASFNVKGDINSASSEVNFDKNNSAKLSMFSIIKDKVSKSLFCLTNFECYKNTTYSVTDLNQQKKIQVSFDHAPYQFYVGDPINIKDISDLKSATITGKLNYYAQSNWPIFQTNRFPYLPTKGTVNIGGEEYLVKNFEQTDSTFQNEIFWTERKFTLKNGAKTAYLIVAKSYNNPSSNAVSITVYDDIDTFYSSDLPNEIWSDSTQEMQLNLEGITVTSDKGVIKKITSSLNFPHDQANLVINNTNQLSLLKMNSVAYVQNDQKKYDLSFKDQSLLTIIQEMNGHYTVYYSGIDINGTCGDLNTVCEGLSVDNKKQNFTFNNVKIGSNTLNGTYYFAGVFE